MFVMGTLFYFILLKILMRSEEGFFLMVESGRIDHAHHNVHATRALSETLTLDAAVERTVDILEREGRLDETLIIVTADHSHTMSIAGYPDRGNDIRGRIFFCTQCNRYCEGKSIIRFDRW